MIILYFLYIFFIIDKASRLTCWWCYQHSDWCYLFNSFYQKIKNKTAFLPMSSGFCGALLILVFIWGIVIVNLEVPLRQKFITLAQL